MLVGGVVGNTLAQHAVLKILKTSDGQHLVHQVVSDTKWALLSLLTTIRYFCNSPRVQRIDFTHQRGLKECQENAEPLYLAQPAYVPQCLPYFHNTFQSARCRWYLIITERASGANYGFMITCRLPSRQSDKHSNGVLAETSPTCLFPPPFSILSFVLSCHRGRGKTDTPELWMCHHGSWVRLLTHISSLSSTVTSVCIHQTTGSFFALWWHWENVKMFGNGHHWNFRNLK